MKILKQIIVTLSIIWTVLSVGFLAVVYFSTPQSCNVNESEEAAAPEASDPLPEFEVELAGGESTLTNESLEGKYTMIYFWGTHCAVCMREMPYLHETYDALEDRDFEIVAISLDDSEETVREFRDQEYPMPWKHAVIGDEEEAIREMTQKFGFSGLPNKVIVSPEGKVLDSFSGFTGEELHEKVEGYLASAE